MLIQTNLLKKALSKIIGIVSSKSTIPIMENVLFSFEEKSVNLTASDLEISGTANIPCEGILNDFCVDGKRLYDTIKMITDDEVEFSMKNFKLEIKTLRGVYKMTGENPVDYPLVPGIGKDGKKIDTDKFIEKIKKVSYATSDDQLRPALNGVYIGKDIVATDGHCLSLMPESNLEKAIIIPQKTAYLVVKNDLELTNVTANEKFIKFDFIGEGMKFTLTSKLIDEPYPDYSAVLPQDYENYLHVSRTELLNAIKRISVYRNEATKQVRLTFSENIKITAQDLGSGSEATEEIDCDYGNGEEVEIGFNGDYLIKTLSALQDEKIKIEYREPIKAAIFRGEEHYCLVMPVRLNN